MREAVGRKPEDEAQRQGGERKAREKLEMEMTQCNAMMRQNGKGEEDNLRMSERLKRWMKMRSQGKSEKKEPLGTRDSA